MACYLHMVAPALEMCRDAGLGTLTDEARAYCKRLRVMVTMAAFAGLLTRT